MNTQGRSFWIVIAVLILLVVIGVFVAIRDRSASGTTAGTATTTPGVVPGLLTTTAPWPVDTANLRTRLSAIGLHALSQEGTALHIHQHLDLYIDGAAVAIPAGIGINEQAQFIAEIHTHDTSGIIHVESPTVQSFTLGEFFDVWGVRFSNECIGGYCNAESKSLRVYVNGALYQGDPRAITLTPHEEIAIVYGDSTHTPAKIPSSYTFPAGY